MVSMGIETGQEEVMQEQIIAVQKMQEYIEEHLQEEITLADLAGVSLFSPWHSYRLFKEYTGLTPADYIRRMKLSQSALCLRGFGNRNGIRHGISECGRLPEGIQKGIWVQFEGICTPSGANLSLYSLRRDL